MSLLDEKCSAKDPLYKHGSGNQTQLIEQLSESSIFEEILTNKDRQYAEQNEIIATLMKKANLTIKEQSKKEIPTSVSPKATSSTIQQSSKSAFYDKKALSSHNLQTILSLSPNPTLDSGDVSSDWIQIPHEPKKLPLEQIQEPELSSISAFLPEHDAFDFLQPAPERKHVRVPLLPLKESIPQVDNDYFHLPYGWEERVNSDGLAYYFNIQTGDISYDIHPSLLMANGWRKCLTDEGEEYYYNDSTGVSCWDAPSDAFDDDNSLICSIASRRLENQSSQSESNSRPNPPIPQPRRRISSPPSSVAISQSPSLQENYSEDGDNTLETVNNQNSDVMYPKTNSEERETMKEMFDTFTTLYSSKADIDVNELGDGVSTLEPFEDKSKEYHGFTGYSSNDADGDTTDVSPPHEDSHSFESEKSSEEEDFVQNEKISSSDSYTHGESNTVDPKNDINSEATDSGEVLSPSYSQIKPVISVELLENPTVTENEDPFANNPNSWITRKDENGREYYENTISGETTWKIPSSASPSNAPSQPKVVSDPTAWQMYFTDNGIPYYFNSSTGESRWTAPSDIDIGESNEMHIRLSTGENYMNDLSPFQSQRERYEDTIYSLLGPGNNNQENGDDEEEESPYLINLMDFIPKGGKKISDLL